MNHAPQPSAPAPAPKPIQPPPVKAAPPPPRNNNPVSPPPPPPSASDRPPALGPLLSAPAPRNEVPQASHPDPAVLRQPQSLQPVAQPEPRGRTPTRQERSRLSAQNDNGAAPAAGGYNFQKIMDDRFEHYERPAKTQEEEELPRGELERLRGTVRGKPGCREPAAGKGLQWSRAPLVTLNPRPVPSMASVSRDIITPRRTGTEPLATEVLTSSCPQRTRSGSEECSRKSHISGHLQSEPRVST